MKIRKSTIVWFLLAAFFCFGAFNSADQGKEDESESKFPKWEDAVYVEDACVLPENEGKLVAISGPLETIEGAKDEQVGVSFESPYVNRTVQRLEWDDFSDKFRWKYVNEGTSDDGWEGGHLIGRIKIGEFELDDEMISRLSLTSRDMNKNDFTEEEISAMKAKGYLEQQSNLYFSEAPMYDEEEYTKYDYILHPDWDGAHAVCWKMWETSLEEGVTVVGIQKGNMLTYCEMDDSLSVKHEIMDKEAFEKDLDSGLSDQTMKYLFIVHAILFLVLGVRSLFKTKKQNGN